MTARIEELIVELIRCDVGCFYVVEYRTICFADQNHCVTSLLLLFTYSPFLHINSSCEISPDSLILEHDASVKTRPCNWANSVII